MHKVLRWSSKASVLGGMLFGLNLAGIRLTSYTHIESEMHALGLVTSLPLLLALIGLHIRCRSRYGGLGRLAFIIMLLSLVVYSIGNFGIALFAALIDIEWIAYKVDTLWVLSIHALGGGAVLLAIALARSRILSFADAFLLIFGGVLLAISPLIPATTFLSYTMPDLKSYLVILALIGPFSIAWIWLGRTLRFGTHRIRVE